jgi:hypothetical protein
MSDADKAPGDSGRNVTERMAGRLQMVVPDEGNRKLRSLIQRVTADDELEASVVGEGERKLLKGYRL